jgi:hypothetical protein
MRHGVLLGLQQQREGREGKTKGAKEKQIMQERIDTKAADRSGSRRASWHQILLASLLVPSRP